MVPLKRTNTPPQRLPEAFGPPDPYDNVSGNANKIPRYDYKHVLKNRHPAKVLYADWQDVDIPFSEIVAGDCGMRERQSTIVWKENPASIIRYGLARQFPFKASAYLFQENRSRVFLRTEQVPDLASTVYARPIWKDERIILDIRFESYLFERTFYYSLNNRSTREFAFDVPKLAARWSRYSLWEPALKVSNWVRGLDKRFRLPRNETIKLAVVLADIKTIQEEEAEITLYLPNETDQMVAVRALCLSATGPLEVPVS